MKQWPTVRLRRVLRLEYGDSLADADRTAGEVPVFGSNGRVGWHDTANTAGPVIVVGRKGSFGKVQFSPEPVFAIDTTFFVDPRSTVADLRWLFYLLQSLRLDELSEDVGVPGLSREKAYAVPVPQPPSSVQREVADFLDAETARIDALIEKKQRLGSLVAERLNGEIEWALREAAAESGEIELQYLADEITVGIVVTPARYYADEGVPALRGINVIPGRLRLDDLVYLSPEGQALHPKSQLRTGNLVTVRTGQAGATAVIPSSLDGANCVDLLITRAAPSVMPEFLEIVINSDWCRKHVSKHSVGAIQGHFNVEALRELPIPRLDRASQETFVAATASARARVDQLAAALERQINLLREHRQALITAAVTGQLEIPEIREIRTSTA